MGNSVSVFTQRNVTIALFSDRSRDPRFLTNCTKTSDLNQTSLIDVNSRWAHHLHSLHLSSIGKWQVGTSSSYQSTYFIIDTFISINSEDIYHSQLMMFKCFVRCIVQHICTYIVHYNALFTFYFEIYSSFNHAGFVYICVYVYIYIYTTEYRRWIEKSYKEALKYMKGNIHSLEWLSFSIQHKYTWKISADINIYIRIYMRIFLPI